MNDDDLLIFFQNCIEYEVDENVLLKYDYQEKKQRLNRSVLNGYGPRPTYFSSYF